MRVTLPRWRRALTAIAAAVVLVGVASAAFLVGDAFGVGSLRVERVSADRLAQAMSTDEFYSDFRGATVIVRGTVTAVSSSVKLTTVLLQASGAARIDCQTDEHLSSIHAGDTVTAVAVAANAQRLPNGVLLTGCVIAS